MTTPGSLRDRLTEEGSGLQFAAAERAGRPAARRRRTDRQVDGKGGINSNSSPTLPTLWVD